jgi:hypothetical protein
MLNSRDQKALILPHEYEDLNAVWGYVNLCWLFFTALKALRQNAFFAPNTVIASRLHLGPVCVNAAHHEADK